MTDEQIVLVGGLWLDASAWDGVVAALTEAGRRAVPVALPGQGDGNTAATLAGQLDAVLATVDSAGTGAGKSVVVGHSAAATLAWMAADARPDRVAKVVLIGGFPEKDGGAYATFFPIEDGVMPFPGWAPFDGPDSADMDEKAREKLAAAAIPVPESVATGMVRLTNEERFDIPVTLICPEFTPDQAREWIAAGDVPELTRVKNLDLIDIDSGHWPMVTRPDELARLLADI